MQGKTRSGKSQATYNVLAQAAANAAVRVVGSDPTHVLLEPFKHRGVSEPYVVSGLNAQATVDMLGWVKRESDRRIDQMWPLRTDKFSEFGASFPLILVVLEEFPGILEGAADEDAALGRKPAERLAPRISAYVRQIAAQSAKAGIRLLLLSQRAEASIIGGNARSNFGVKMTLRVDEPESVRMLHPSASPEDCALVETFKPGTCLFEKPGEGRQIMRCDFVGEYGRYARAIESSDLRFLATLQQDQAQREFFAEEFGVVDPS
nr:hypothetical protein [Rhodococcus erythropolis]